MGDIAVPAITVPVKILKAVKAIEEYAAKMTDRDDWAIGNITCRRGAERLQLQYKQLLEKYNNI